ncbi:hypothetical protein DEAC_c17390 [Desulfosporosinus acididurans]|uniref:Uncharacterized protein n=1 Tax=Desulfosporosinus acididurans TaxID=476652 RepID=A0A0J1FS67_9FIRM|nr:hypothetical protein [Desulfosporosinus acididurans]KLU66340.1 hypothetical protein DEAC_c17390 [Desulfosporosinus acididurans]
MNLNQSVLKTAQDSAKLFKSIQPTLDMVKNIGPILESVKATSALHAVSGSTAPLLSNQ